MAFSVWPQKTKVHPDLGPVAGAVSKSGGLTARGVNIGYHLARTGTWLNAVSGVDLVVAPGEFVTIIGPSGCGKSTFLDAVAGLQPISQGSIELDGRKIVGPGSDRAMVFQRPTLLPWRTVTRNVAFGLEMRGYSRKDSGARARELLDVVGLGAFGNVYPSELSGGMQQRVNIARALAVDPDILLLDEPFASLDALSREAMQLELMRIWAATQKTALFITHDIREALLLSDRIVVFSGLPGRVKSIFDVNFPRPRSKELFSDPHFVELERLISEQLDARVD